MNLDQTFSLKKLINTKVRVKSLKQVFSKAKANCGQLCYEKCQIKIMSIRSFQQFVGYEN
jgi:hypothetical protein